MTETTGFCFGLIFSASCAAASDRKLSLSAVALLLLILPTELLELHFLRHKCNLSFRASGSSSSSDCQQRVHRASGLSSLWSSYGLFMAQIRENKVDTVANGLNWKVSPTVEYSMKIFQEIQSKQCSHCGTVLPVILPIFSFFSFAPHIFIIRSLPALTFMSQFSVN